MQKGVKVNLPGIIMLSPVWRRHIGAVDGRCAADFAGVFRLAGL